MFNITENDATKLWIHALEHLKYAGAVHAESRDQQTREILGMNMTLANPRQRLVLAYPQSTPFLCAEILWILAGFNSVEYLEFWNPKMRDFSDDGEWFYGAYGARLGNITESPAAELCDEHFVGCMPYIMENQMGVIYQALKNNPNTRQAVMDLWSVEDDIPNIDGSPRSKDIPCNLNSQLLVRDGKLYWFQTQRSQDAIWGLPTNLFQWTMLHEIMAGWLGVELGDFNLRVASFHIYERHWDWLEKLNHLDYEDVHNKENFALPKEEYDNIIPALVGYCDKLRTCEIDEIEELTKNCNLDVIGSWEQIIWILAAEAYRRRNDEISCLSTVENMSNYWKQSYMNWYNRKAGV